MEYKKYLQTNEAKGNLDKVMADKKIDDAIMKAIIAKWDKDYKSRKGGIDAVPTSTMKKDITDIVNKHAKGWDKKKKDMIIYNYYSSLTGEY